MTEENRTNGKVTQKIFDMIQGHERKLEDIDLLMFRLCSAVEALPEKFDELKSSMDELRKGLLKLLINLIIGVFILFTILLVAVTGVYIKTAQFQIRATNDSN